jgi:hypothetical protein
MPSGTSFSIAEKTSCGPSEQLTPTASAPRAFKASPIATISVPSAIASS